MDAEDILSGVHVSNYIDTKGNGEYLRKCIFEGPYKLTSVVIEAVAATVNSPEVPQHDEAKIVHNMSAENKLYFQAEKEAIFLLLTGIGDEIYSTCLIAMKFTSRDGESMESYYSWFYKLMNELTRNNLKVTTMQVNVQFLQQLQPECDPEQAQRDKEMQDNLALLAKYFKKLYKPTNNNLRTSSNSRNKTEDTPTKVCNRMGIYSALTARDLGTNAKGCRKPKRVKDYTYHKEKMMMCKQAKQGVLLQAEQANWLEETDEEIDE
ncbi:hypothetical protein Tco_0873952 [Tanacetum coccineum]|uniref:Gag protein n=1 Tax=Tanacetum coccineum TaxID=301880 RepID=A0ABQ5BKA4_9ASTR